jgi:maltose alpha-D-glucosyltransferase / alpha-amylase
MPNTTVLSADPLWYKDAVVYEVHVRAFFDQNNDGMRDFTGLTQKLDYLQDLGVTAIRVLPFCPSPWRDDGDDISDYVNVHPAYETLRDLQTFLPEAHNRGLRVITELVLNHTSGQHVWFQRSRRRNYYVGSDSPERYTGARIIFKDFEASNWTYAHQPDLNSDNPEVGTAMFTEQILALIRIFLIDLALRKVTYEWTHGPERIRIPAHALNELLETL